MASVTRHAMMAECSKSCAATRIPVRSTCRLAAGNCASTPVPAGVGPHEPHSAENRRGHLPRALGKAFRGWPQLLERACRREPLSCSVSGPTTPAEPFGALSAAASWARFAAPPCVKHYGHQDAAVRDTAARARTSAAVAATSCDASPSAASRSGVHTYDHVKWQDSASSAADEPGHGVS